MPVAVKIYREGGSKSKSGYAYRKAIPYRDIEKMSQQSIKKLMDEWRRKEAELAGRKDLAAKAQLKVARLNIRRLGRRYAVVFNKLPYPDQMPVDSPGKVFCSTSPLPWKTEERLDEELFLESREKRVKELLRIVKSGRGFRIEIKLRDDGAWFEILKKKEVVKEEKISDVMTVHEVREVLRGGLEGMLGSTFRALLRKFDK